MHPHRRIRNHPVRERFLKIKENTYGKQQEKATDPKYMCTVIHAHDRLRHPDLDRSGR